MPAKRQVSLPIRDAHGFDRGTVHIAVLPKVKHDEEVLWDCRRDPDKDPTLEDVQVLENHEYRFKIKLKQGLDPGTKVVTSHPDVFEPSVDSGAEGRLRPRLHTGVLTVWVSADAVRVGQIVLEVRSTKLHYVKHYRWMLKDIAEQYSELLLERFAATEQRFQLAKGDASTLYQRFAFLKHLISGEQFEAAIQQVLGRPHRTWVDQEELRRPGERLPATAHLSRRVVGATGPRIMWPGHPIALPIQIPVRASVETTDTPENRFAKFALTRWRDVTLDIERMLRQEGESSPVARGRVEVRLVQERLDELLSAPLFAEVGPLLQMPTNSQVLQKRAGYRDVLRAYVQFEAAAALTWKGGEDVYQAGQRNVAALYEYWVFLRLREVVRSLCEDRLYEETLFEQRNGLMVTLKRGETLSISGNVARHGRRLRLELYFNHRFAGTDSWTMPMHPDCSLRICPGEGNQVPFDEVWVHFDAKYRIDHWKEIFGSEQQDLGQPGGGGAQESRAPPKAGRSTRDDLLKMHAYRDAIRKSAGSYVIYPGSAQKDENDQPPFRMYHEILPGLGAFVLRPTESGKAMGFEAVRDFIRDVLDHVASQATQHERGRYWERQAYDDRSLPRRVVPSAPFIEQPPADTKVLLGYVKNTTHLEWVHKSGLYNLRADGRPGTVVLGSDELAAKLLILYSKAFQGVEVWKVKGHPVVLTRTNLEEMEYPVPGSEFYYCLQLETQVNVEDWDLHISTDRILEIWALKRPELPHGHPVATTWLELVR